MKKKQKNLTKKGEKSPTSNVWKWEISSTWRNILRLKYVCVSVCLFVFLIRKLQWQMCLYSQRKHKTQDTLHSNSAKATTITNRCYMKWNKEEQQRLQNLGDNNLKWHNEISSSGKCNVLHFSNSLTSKFLFKNSLNTSESKKKTNRKERHMKWET